MPPPQLVVSSRQDSNFDRIADAIYAILRKAGYPDEEVTGLFIRSIKGRKGWFTWSVKVPEQMERVLLDKGRFISGVQTFQVRRYLSITQCRICVRFGHDTCSQKPSCFRCGSQEHQAKDCRTHEEICVPCKKEGLSHTHRGKVICASYRNYLQALKNKNNQKEYQRKTLHQRTKEAATQADKQQRREVSSEPILVGTPKPKRNTNPKKINLQQEEKLEGYARFDRFEKANA